MWRSNYTLGRQYCRHFNWLSRVHFLFLLMSHPESEVLCDVKNYSWLDACFSLQRPVYFTFIKRSLRHSRFDCIKKFFFCKQKTTSVWLDRWWKYLQLDWCGNKGRKSKDACSFLFRVIVIFVTRILTYFVFFVFYFSVQRQSKAGLGWDPVIVTLRLSTSKNKALSWTGTEHVNLSPSLYPLLYKPKQSSFMLGVPKSSGFYWEFGAILSRESVLFALRPLRR